MLQFILRSKIIIFTIASAVGLYYMWDPLYLLISLISYVFLCVIGHFIGLHRYYSHSSFTCNKLVEGFLFICSFLSGSGEPIGYTQRHTRHHMYADTPKDHLFPKKHPILTWIGHAAIKSEYVDTSKIAVPKRLTSNKFYVFINKYYDALYYIFIALALLLSFKLAFYILIVGGTIGFHSGYSISVLCHNYGYRNFDVADTSTNNTFINWYTFGTGLHNNHHAVPNVYTHKIREDETDISAWFIKKFLATSVVEVTKRDLKNIKENN